jgi:hypothetical protein
MLRHRCPRVVIRLLKYERNKRDIHNQSDLRVGPAASEPGAVP